MIVPGVDTLSTRMFPFPVPNALSTLMLFETSDPLDGPSTLMPEVTL